MSGNIRNIVQFPAQKLPDSKKNEEWQHKCIDAAESLCVHNNRQIRQSFQNKKINYNLYNNILDTRDIEKICNQHNLDISSFPAKMQHIGIGSGRIRKLVGEEMDRKYEWRAVLSSKDELGISSKETEIRDIWMSVLNEELKNQSSSDEELEKKLQETQKYLSYEFQDIKEITANKLLRYEYYKQDLKHIFNRCFEDLLITAEEIACVEEIGGEPIVRKVNPLNLFYLSSPETVDIEDSDIIVEYSYMSVGQVVDHFYDYLTSEQITNLETGNEHNATINFGGIAQSLNRNLTLEERYGDVQNTLFMNNSVAHYALGGAYDSYGNVRVVKAVWRSRRKIGKLSYYDEFGQLQEDIVPETYKVDKSLGETVEWLWVNEWWEGHKIGLDIYCKIRPIPYQGRSKHNLSKSMPPYVGIVANTNSQKAMSMMDIIKPLDYLYDVYNYRTELAVAKYLGPMLAFNMSLIPSGMGMKEWLHYVTTTGMMPLDPTNEILKGPSQGKSAGAFNTVTAQNINSDLGNFIQQHLLLMQDIERRIEIISGVSNQSLGQIAPQERVGNVNQVLKANSQITEKWFNLHDRFKRKVLQRLLDTAKYVYRNNPFRAHFILDDLQNVSLEMSDDFFEHDYDIMVTNSVNDTELFYALKQLAHAAMQSGQATFADVVSIYKSESVQSLSRKLEDSARRLMEQQQAAQQQANEAKMAEIQQRAESEDKDREIELYKIDVDAQTKIQVAQINAYRFQEDLDLDDDGIPDPIEIGKLALEQQKVNSEMQRKQLELDVKRQEVESNKALKEKELRIKKEIEDKKIEAIRVQNESQERMQEKQLKAKEREMAQKAAIERMKARNKPKPKS